MATKYWIGNGGPTSDLRRWSNSTGNNFTISRENPTSNYFIYSNLIGTLAIGQAVFGRYNNDTFGDSEYLGTISDIITSTKKIRLSGGDYSPSTDIANVNWCSGTIGTALPLDNDTIIFNDRSGTQTIYIPETYTSTVSTKFSTTDLTGFSGEISGSINTKNLILSPIASYSTQLGYYNFLVANGSISMASGTPRTDLGFVNIAIGGYYYRNSFGSSFYSSDNSSIVSLASNIDSLDTNSATVNFFIISGTFNTNNYNIKNYYFVTDDPAFPLTTNTVTINLGSSTIESTLVSLLASGAGRNYTLTLNPGTSTVIVNNLTNAYGSTLYNVSLKGLTSGNYSCNTFTTIWDGSGSMPINANISANNFVLNDSSILGYTGKALTKVGGGPINIKNSSLQRLTVYPIRTFYATNCENLGSNTNITFSTNSFMAFF